ncbi:MAG: glycosyltransferase [Candidatus Omnitrophica bacterium]|nr:glycosyltransferase [Candidatus Omnitrophota bacterium]
MKILLQNQYDDLLGGVETYFKLVVDALIEKGHEVVAVYTKSGKKKDIKNNGFKAVYLPNLDLTENTYYAGTQKKEIKNDINLLKSMVINEKPDLIHLNNTHYPSQYNFLNQYAPVIQTVHDFFNCCNIVLKMLPEGVCNNPLGANCFKNKCISADSIMELWRFKTKSLNRQAMKKFQRLLVTTPYMQEVLICNGFRDDKIKILPLFVEDWGMNIKSQEPVIIYVGRLAKEKGVIHFIQMLKGLSIDFKAFIIGDGPQKEECENLVKIMGLNQKVEFTGFLNRNEIKDYFAKASVVVIPSLWPEPFCLVGLEAMSCSKPVVAYDTGGISSWLKDNHNGYLVRRGDLAGLARQVEALLKNKQLAQDMGKNGRQLFESKFSKNTHLKNLIAVYEDVVLSKKAKNKFFNLKFHRIANYVKRLSGVKASKESNKYPERFSDESLPEFNKRLIEFERKNNICLVRSHPEEITISTTTRCNMNPPCVMCERNLRTKDLEYDIDTQVLEMIKPIFKFADRIYLHCGGEPLITDKIFEVIGSVKPPTKIIFNTNGALFTQEKIKYMVDCNVVDVISFSLDAATEKTYQRIRSADFNKIINNIKALIGYRNERNQGKPLLRPLVLLNFCIFKQNIAEVPDYVLLAHKLGADGIDFSHLNQGFDWQQNRKEYIFDYKNESVLNMPDAEEHDKLIVQAYELGKQYNMPINFNGNPFIAKSNSEKIKLKNELSEVLKYKKICLAPWNRVVIETDGRVRICYFHDNKYQVIGKLKVKASHVTLRYKQSNSFNEIWNGAEAISARQEFIQNGIAKRCVTENPCIFQNRL